MYINRCKGDGESEAEKRKEREADYLTYVKQAWKNYLC